MEIIPANIGLSDNGLSTLIRLYNEMLTERKRLLRTSSESNPAVVNLDTSLEATRKNIQTSVASVLKGLEITRTTDPRGRPVCEPDQQCPPAGKRTAQHLPPAGNQGQSLSDAASETGRKCNNLSCYGKQWPYGRRTLGRRYGWAESKTYYMLALILGLGIPVAFIFLRNLLRFKIESRADIEKITDVPVVGDIPLTDTEGHPIVVQENRNGLMEEVFRSVRTNVQYMLGEGQKVILFTSTTSGEGKSFNAGNRHELCLYGQEGGDCRTGYPQTRTEQSLRDFS